ncbi:MAG: hemolysin [Deltaproteobacteria bacterium]|nr:MAG: hemolysin [Deltaproteobacteria bacterium]
MVIRLREPVNGLTHAIGVALSIAGLVFLILKSVDPVKVWHIVTFSIFGAGLILLYLASTLYHWLPLGADGIRRLRKLDHSMIFFLIAATYTPICLIPLRGGWGWSIFGVVWGLALIGTTIKLAFTSTPRLLSTSIYLLMGWVVIVAIYPLSTAIQTGALVWLFIGGLLYSIGAVIYALKRPNLIPNVLGFHELFHIFVVLGSLSHFWVMYNYVSTLE